MMSRVEWTFLHYFVNKESTADYSLVNNLVFFTFTCAIKSDVLKLEVESSSSLFDNRTGEKIADLKNLMSSDEENIVSEFSLSRH